MSIILGLNAFHPDSSACLIIDGKLVAAVAEERLGDRIKHTKSFPINAVSWVMDFANVRLKDVDYIAVARDTRANFFAKATYSAANVLSISEQVRRFVRRKNETVFQLNNLAHTLGQDQRGCHYRVVHIEHHLAHLCSSYFVSNFDTATGFTYDGSGDFVSAMHAVCEGNNVIIQKKVNVPHSLGHFYSALCQFIGFDRFGEEYKVMGLAPYGNDSFRDELNKLVKLSDDKWFHLEQKYFDIQNGLSNAYVSEAGSVQLGRLFSENLIKLLGMPRKRDSEITQREMDIARSTQLKFEQAALHCLKNINDNKSIQNLVMAGGCALNGVMNARILREINLNGMYLQSASSDDGTAIGAAYACWHLNLGKTQRFHMCHSFWGPEYDDRCIRDAIDKTNLRVEKFDTEAAKLKKTAALIAKGKIVGWYQGRSEWGPRALGNRSILANPLIPDMKKIINEKIKKRESFRPFAPSVLIDDVSKYFEQDIDSPFMMHVVKFKKEYSNMFPSVTHVDGTGRLQSVRPENNLLYYKLIKELKKLTGFGIVLNTSFNENEPIVDTPEQAIACFTRTDMDVLVVGDYLLTKDKIL